MKKQNPSRARKQAVENQNRAYAQAVKYHVTFIPHDGDCWGKVTVYKNGSLWCDFVQGLEAAMEFAADLRGSIEVKRHAQKKNKFGDR
jgi:hypothetical protein